MPYFDFSRIWLSVTGMPDFFTFYLLNMDISLDIKVTYIRFSACVENIHMEGTCLRFLI